MKDLISVVLPVYNGEQYLRESLDSIRKQTYTNWELLILDDCSTDSTPTIAKEYAQLDERIHYYRNETNLKLPGNLNRGFSLAKGQYLTWTSDDNMYYPDAFERMINALKQNPSAHLVYASYQVIDENGENIQVNEVREEDKVQILGSNVVGACFMYTRQAYEKVGDYNADLFWVEDFDYWQRIFMHFPVVVIPDVLYAYRWHEKSLTSTRKQALFGERMERMLLQNRPGFGKISLEMNYHYYRLLNKSREDQGGKNPYKLRYKTLYFWFRVKRKLCGK